ncbi:unconventional myosin-XVIIIa-like isoform X2 [Daktulosphaira vitifoliae]|uniref:unconventional myosin-XVIIIa-like isoform X2 n=1 Tax=Daktulosphaira vitifoliae TaxID=58002 RepID=UPI0021AA65B5|nr:unconventional myosin-XVIIIa-like isoform X2 [Daktulosphaira vitifoliae]
MLTMSPGALQGQSVPGPKVVGELLKNTNSEGPVSSAPCSPTRRRIPEVSGAPVAAMVLAKDMATGRKSTAGGAIQSPGKLSRTSAIPVRPKPVPPSPTVRKKKAADNCGRKLKTCQRPTSVERPVVETSTKLDVDFINDQLPPEVESNDSEAFWLVHSDGFSPVQYSKKKSHDENGRVLVKVFGGKEYTVDEDSLEKMNPMKMQLVDDLAQLNYMNESSVLNVIRSRYASNLIHTYCGPTMLVVNPGAPLNLYTDKVMDMVKNLHKINKQPPPHIYALAQSVYKTAVTTRRDQSLIPMGCQASGKTTSCKHILQYLLKIAASPSKVVTLEKLDALWTVLEAFGNAAITNNPNATRSVQLFSVDLDQGGQIASMSIQMHFYDKWRLIDHPPNEYSFHVFYYLLAGVENVPSLRKELLLDQITDDLKGVDKSQAAVEFTNLQSAMMIIGFTNVELKAIFSVLAAIIHLNHTKIVKKDSIYKDKVQWTWSNSDAAKRAAKCLGAGNSDDLFSLVFPDLESFDEFDISGQLNSLIMGLYTETFNLVASIVNRKLAPSVHSLCSILIPDYPGYVIKPQSTLNMFDFWTHYLYEKILSSYHSHAVVTPLEKYKVEKVETTASYEAEFCAEDNMLKLFVGAKGAIGFARSSSMVDLKHEAHPGLLRILDDTAGDTKSTDKDLIEKINSLIKEKSFSNILKKGNRSDEFTLVHFRETISSTYCTKGWTDMCRDYTSRIAIGLLHESSNIDISNVFSKSRGAGLTSTLAIVDGTQTLRRVSSIRRATFSSLSTTATLKRKLMSVQIRFAVDGLIETLRRTGQHFVHCLMPKIDAGYSNRTDVATIRVFHSLYKLTSSTLSPISNKPNLDFVDIPLLRKQMRGMDILPTIRFFKQGYPISMFIVEFIRKFALFLPNNFKNEDINSTIKDYRQCVTEIMSKADLDESLYKIGVNQIFFRAGVVQTLESQRDEKLSGVITQLQAQCRGYLARKDFAKLKVNDIAIRCIQRNVKKFMLVRDWPWWRLLVRITPLLNVHRTEYELKQKSDELDQLRVRVDKLEQERSQLKADNDRLEQRLADTTADLAEEHSTVTMVSERLEMESAERQRLEKELQEVQSAKNRLAETNEQLEMQLLCLRSTDPSLMSSSSSVAGTVSDDDSAVATSDKGDQYYRRRYERVCRELDYAKKRLQQQHNDDMEQLVAMKKQLEKKLAGVYEDVEEQRQIVAQWKRKVNKLNAESNDLKLMLEESNSRNNLLEKKQKKFDTEIHSLQEELKNDKALREKITREKDMAISDKFAMEQNLSSVRLELELKEQKVVGLNRELQELTFNGNTEEEVAALKRSKHQLENKLKDQEEELDDLAGQVQLLEQVKTRLEMGLEQERKEHRRELAQREQENEEIRCSAAKKIKALECEIENEHEERTALIRERHDLERRLVDAEDRERCRSMNDQETIARFRRDMKKLKALLRDAQTVQEQRSDSHANRIAIRQLRNQLEDAESARDSAIKARLMAETDLAEVTATLDEVQATKRASEERAAAFSRDKNHLQSQLDENEEELAEVLKKYRGTVQQLSAEQSIQQEQASRIAELETDKTNLQERLAELTFRLDNMETHGDPAGSLNLKRLQLRVTELESKLQLELTTRTRLEVQITRLKEAAERLESEREAAQSKENSAQETLRKMQRSLREARESMTERETKESADTNRKRALEKRAEQAEAEVATVKADLALALQRIDDLQAAMTGDLDDDDEFQSDSDDDDDGDSDDSVNTFLANQGTRNTSVLQQKSLDSN